MIQTMLTIQMIIRNEFSIEQTNTALKYVKDMSYISQSIICGLQRIRMLINTYCV